MAYYHHVDDSGDPGAEGAPGASGHFALAMVQLAGRGELPELAAIRRTLHLEPAFEFKYHRMRARQKEVFFKAIRTVSYRVRAVALDKTRLPPSRAGLTGQALTVELLAGLIMRASDMEIANDVLVTDAATPAFLRALRLRLSEECHQTGRVRPFKKLVAGDSRHKDGCNWPICWPGPSGCTSRGVNAITSRRLRIEFWIYGSRGRRNKTPPTILLRGRQPQVATLSSGAGKPVEPVY